MTEGPWKDTIRRETGLIEHTCIHGVGHPAWGSTDWMTQTTGQESWDVHGCDGCCGDPDWLTADLKEGIHVANQLILEHKNALSELSDENIGYRHDLAGLSADVTRLLDAVRRHLDLAEIDGHPDPDLSSFLDRYYPR